MIQINIKDLTISKKIGIIIGMILICIILVYINYAKNNESKGAIIESSINKESSEDATEIIKVAENICVHISGEIRNPGIVILEEKARIIDAIEAAGGLTEDADISYVNLAYGLKDGIKIYIPSTKDSKDEKSEYLSLGGGENVVEKTNIEESKSNQKVNINTATKSELESLTGIGPSTADRIIEFRKMNGKFKSIDDIKNVSGIGNSKYEAIKTNIEVK